MTNSHIASPDRSVGPTPWGEYSGHSPKGWPGSVPPPAHDQFSKAAKEWLLSLAPGRWQFSPVLHRFPLLLARMVRFHLESGMAGSTLNIRTAHKDLADVLPESSIDDFVEFCELEYERMQLLSLQVKLVEVELERRYCRMRQEAEEILTAASPVDAEQELPQPVA